MQRVRLAGILFVIEFFWGGVAILYVGSLFERINQMESL